MASLWQIPILYVLENNQIAQTTPINKAISGSLTERFSAFGILVEHIESSDVLEIRETSAALIEKVRRLQIPCALILKTARFGPHSKGDDTRSPEEIASLRQNYDPITIHARRLDPTKQDMIQTSVQAEIAGAFQQALNDPFPELDSFASDPAQISSEEWKSR
jgi:TPP-dependent pyruvate/acetoin dehydrogenase alpha subunit